MTWILAVGTTGASGAPQRQLTRAKSRRFTPRLDGGFDFQFSIDARADEAALLTPLASDVWAWRDGTRMFRGRYCPAQGQLSPDVHTITIQCVDYRGLLTAMNRNVGAAGRTFAATDQGTIAWTLINESQALSGGALGITDGVGSTSGTTRDRTLDPFKPIAEDIAQMGRLDDGFEWEIDPLLALNRWYPTRGTVTGVVLDYGGVISSASWQVDPTRFGNHVAVTGSEGLTPVTATSGTVATDPRGRWERVESYPSVVEQATLTARAPALLAQTSVLDVDWTVTLTPGRWLGPTHFWIGDTVTLAVKDGPWNFADPYRVVEMQIAIGESGEEVVQVSLVAA